MSKPLTTNPSNITAKLRKAGVAAQTTSALPRQADGDFAVSLLVGDSKLAEQRDLAIDVLHKAGYHLTQRGERVLCFAAPQTIISVQPSSYVDNLWLVDRDVDDESYHPDTDTAEIVEGTKMPYPFHARKNDGRITRQDFWSGTPWRIVGFSNTPQPGRVDLFWHSAEFQDDPQTAVGKYVVTQDRGGGMAVHQTAVASVTVTEVLA